MSFIRADVPDPRRRRVRLALGNLLLATAFVVICASSGARGNSLVVPFDQSTGYGFDPDFGLPGNFDFGADDWRLAGDVEENPAPWGEQLLITWEDTSFWCNQPGDDCSFSNSLIEMIWNVSLNPDHPFDGLPGDEWFINLILVASDQNGFQNNTVGVLYDSAEIDGVPAAFGVSVYEDALYFLSLDLGPLTLGETRQVRFRYEVLGDLRFDEDENTLAYPFVTGAAFVVPEPGTGLLLGLGLVGIGLARRRS